MRLVPATRSFSKGKQFHMPAQVISAHKANCCFGLSSLRGTAANFRSTKTHEVVCRRSQLSQRLTSTRVPTSHGKKKSWSNCTLGDWKLCSETLACGSRLYLSLEHFDYLWSAISIIALTRTERFLAFWLVDKTTDHGNDVMVADSRASRVLLGGSRFNLSFEHFDDISIWVDMSQYRPWKIVVDLLNRQWENVMYLLRSLLALEVPHHMSLSYVVVRSRGGGLVAGDWYATVLSRGDLWWVRSRTVQTVTSVLTK